MTYLQQENENFSKDCFAKEQCKLTSRNSVILCNTKSGNKVSRRTKHQG